VDRPLAKAPRKRFCRPTFCDPQAPEATWHRFPAVCRKIGVIPVVDVSLPGEPAPVVAGWKKDGD
jgi:hypothetical protein